MSSESTANITIDSSLAHGLVTSLGNLYGVAREMHRLSVLTRAWTGEISLGSYVMCATAHRDDSIWVQSCESEIVGKPSLVIAFDGDEYLVVFGDGSGQTGQMLLRREWLTLIPAEEVSDSVRKSLAHVQRMNMIQQYGYLTNALMITDDCPTYIPGTFVMHAGKIGVTAFLHNEHLVVIFVDPILHLRTPPVSELRRATTRDWPLPDTDAYQDLILMYGEVYKRFVSDYIGTHPEFPGPEKVANFSFGCSVPHATVACCSVKKQSGCKRPRDSKK